MPRPLSPARRRAALAVAIVVDLLQIVVQATGPFQLLLDWPLDLLTALAMLALVGFHWAFLPTFLAEAVPWLDVVPTWTLALILATRAPDDERAEAKTVPPGPPELNGPPQDR
ncbi:MAG TPA: hypothetical protein VFT46_03775 [Holophagaceae bacterium]|nr:hypothetical protein [Holophagaceae bacterium]